MPNNVRMCSVCRQRFPKEKLIRIVKNKNGEILIDKTYKADGRGSYVCTGSECLSKLKKSKALNKSFKCQVAENIYDNIIEGAIGKQREN